MLGELAACAWRALELYFAVCFDGADLLPGLRVQCLDLSVARAHQDVAADAAGGVEAKAVHL